jgi:hypothetical protein
MKARSDLRTLRAAQNTQLTDTMVVGKISIAKDKMAAPSKQNAPLQCHHLEDFSNTT